jgi:hypothetical protein
VFTDYHSQAREIFMKREAGMTLQMTILVKNHLCEAMILSRTRPPWATYAWHEWINRRQRNAKPAIIIFIIVENNTSICTAFSFA